jgi:predicted RNA-binding Zn-ribbon protein involved in translation (DUF1610 family)
VPPEEKTCPACGVSLVGDPIPEPDRYLFGGSTHFGRAIGIEIPGVYDGVLYWQCPDCGHTWDRFPPGDRRHGRRA